MHQGWALYAQSLCSFPLSPPNYPLFFSPSHLLSHLHHQLVSTSLFIVDVGTHSLSWPSNLSLSFLSHHFPPSPPFPLSLSLSPSRSPLSSFSLRSSLLFVRYLRFFK
mmetsp:Transcript_14247/g.22179  ORF Transcript_14247/g.22179 Transcript_14247/m.22179 type:complete len:108 (+) Transcript_14247:1097-1420(+)